jgi:2-C-methyl-D-erythritol 4-phosphate cytidylyltransferase
MGQERTPKAFLRLAGRTLLEWSVAAVEVCPEVEGFVVALPPGHGGVPEAVSRSPKLLELVPGGDSRQESVRLALTRVPPRFDVVVCHDVARPLAGPTLFSAVVGALAHADGAVPVVPVTDTVKRVRGGEVVETVAREELGAAQTPQAFRRPALERSHGSADATATDDAALLERAGFRVAAVPGEPANLKVTRLDDLAIAEALRGLDA